MDFMGIGDWGLGVGDWGLGGGANHPLPKSHTRNPNHQSRLSQKQ